MNYVSIRSIFPTLALDRSQIDEYRILEWATEAYESINVKQEYEDKVAVINIENHKGRLPSGINSISSVAYLHNVSPNQEDWKSICELLSQEDQVMCGCNITFSETNTGSLDVEPPATLPVNYYAPNQYNIQRVKSQGIINNYSLWMKSSFYSNNFSFMRLRKGAFSTQIHCSGCPNLSCFDCEHTYNVTPNGEIVTDFKEGVVCVAYKSIPLDNEGLVMIPDDPDIRKAINAYVSAKHWELRWNMKEQGSGERYQTFLNVAEKLMAKVKGKLGIRNIDYQKVRFIADRYRNMFNQPVVWNDNPGITLE